MGWVRKMRTLADQLHIQLVRDLTLNNHKTTKPWEGDGNLAIGLVLVPTRELALQTSNVLGDGGSFTGLVGEIRGNHRFYYYYDYDYYYYYYYYYLLLT